VSDFVSARWSEEFPLMAAKENTIAKKETWIALLARRDTPTDGVQDYCAFLSRALGTKGIQMALVQVRWMEDGWLRGLRQLWRQSARWQGQWVILQYTALAWSRHGFPFGAIATLAILRRRQVRFAVVFHEPSRQREVSTRWIDRIRGACQDWVIRTLYAQAMKAIFTIPLERVAWLAWVPKRRDNAVFIPIGANIPEPVSGSEARRSSTQLRTVVVFCFTRGPNRSLEAADVVTTIRIVREEGIQVRLIALGGGSAEVRDEIECGLAGTGVEVSVLGLVPADEVTNILSAADAQLFVAGYVSQRRGSVMAGIACGLPIIGYAGGAEGTQIEEAGLFLVPFRDSKALGTGLVKVLRTEELAVHLRSRSRKAQSNHFSWISIASRYVSALKTEVAPESSSRSVADLHV
jgi:glycosyltransferase involved in cell wall biosynthesis